jgi:hypothetical protein
MAFNLSTPMKTTSKARLALLIQLFSLILIGCHSALAQGTSIYFDRTAFSNALQVVPGTRQSISSLHYLPGEFSPQVTLMGVTFRGLYLVEYATNFLYNFDSYVPLTIHFNTGALAFGADFSSYLPPQHSSFTATLSLDNGEAFNFTAPGTPGSQFFGFISPSPIMDLTFSDGGIFRSGQGSFHEELIGNMDMVLQVPEPGSLAFLLLGLPLLVRRKHP